MVRVKTFIILSLQQIKKLKTNNAIIDVLIDCFAFYTEWNIRIDEIKIIAYKTSTNCLLNI